MQGVAPSAGPRGEPSQFQSYPHPTVSPGSGVWGWGDGAEVLLLVCLPQCAGVREELALTSQAAGQRRGRYVGTTTRSCLLSP